MKTSTYLTVAGAVAVLFALGFLLTPASMAAMYGVPSDPSNIMQARYFGSALGAWGVITLMMRNVRDPEALRGLLGGSIVGHVLGIVVTLWALMAKSIGPMAWSSVVVYALLGIGAWMCLSQQRAAHPAPA